MSTSINLHWITSIKVESTKTEEGHRWLEFHFSSKDGGNHTVTAFFEEGCAVEIEGAEFVNFVAAASAEPIVATPSDDQPF